MDWDNFGAYTYPTVPILKISLQILELQFQNLVISSSLTEAIMVHDTQITSNGDPYEITGSSLSFATPEWVFSQ